MRKPKLGTCWFCGEHLTEHTDAEYKVCAVALLDESYEQQMVRMANRFGISIEEAEAIDRMVG